MAKFFLLWPNNTTNLSSITVWQLTFLFDTYVLTKNFSRCQFKLYIIWNVLGLHLSPIFRSLRSASRTRRVFGVFLWNRRNFYLAAVAFCWALFSALDWCNIFLNFILWTHIWSIRFILFMLFNICVIIYFFSSYVLQRWYRYSGEYIFVCTAILRFPWKLSNLQRESQHFRLNFLGKFGVRRLYVRFTSRALYSSKSIYFTHLHLRSYAWYCVGYFR